MRTALRAVGLTKIYRNGPWSKPIVALRDLSLEVMEGEIFGILGPNGAGKTTTFKILMGFIKPTKGEAWIFDRRISDPLSRRGVGFLPESPYLPDHLTAEEFLRLHAELIGLPRREADKRIGELLEMVGLEEFASVRLKKFSRGMLQRIGIAQALIGDPQLVILDEPTSGLDPIGRKEMRELILRLKSEGKTVIYSSHILSDVESICDRVAILSKGRLLGVGRLEDVIGEGDLEEGFARMVKGGEGDEAD